MTHGHASGEAGCGGSDWGMDALYPTRGVANDMPCFTVAGVWRKLQPLFSHSLLEAPWVRITMIGAPAAD